MNAVINKEVVMLVALYSFVVAKIVSLLTDRLPFWAKLADTGREIGGYVIIVISGLLMWSTGLDMLPGFNGVVPWLGRVLTCIVGAFGPSVVYDMALDKGNAVAGAKITNIMSK